MGSSGLPTDFPIAKPETTSNRKIRTPNHDFLDFPDLVSPAEVSVGLHAPPQSLSLALGKPEPPLSPPLKVVRPKCFPGW